MTTLLDSVILIDHFNGIPAATAYLRQMRLAAAISVITRAEVLTGFTTETEATGRQLLDLFPVLPFTREVADLAAQYRRTHRWKLPDAFQAALAETHQLQLATRNTRDFLGKFERLVIPYSIP